MDRTLEQLQDHFKGKKGNEEGETHVIDSNADRSEGFVTVWSNKNDAAKILERCSKDVLEYEYRGGGVSLKIDRKAFRGLHCAFRRSK